MNKLYKELVASGANEEEIRSLLPVASSLSSLKAKHMHHWVRSTSFALSGLIVGALIIVLAQAASPASWLFSIQKATDNVAIIISPDYRADVMMKRADQVNQLVAAHSNDGDVMAILNEYTKEAQAYKATTDNYTAFNYCKTKLMQAAEQANPRIRSAIASSLQTIETS